MHRVLAATCAAVAEFIRGMEVTIRHLFDVMGVTPGEHLLASAEKTDARRLQQAERQKRKHVVLGELPGQLSPSQQPTMLPVPSRPLTLCCWCLLGH